MENNFKLLALTIFLVSTPMAAYAYENNSSAQKSPQSEHQNYDIQFLDTMVRHHQDGLKMFQIAVDKAQNPDVKEMAKKMIQAQKKEIPELQTLRNEVEPEAPMSINMDMPGMMQMDVSKLNKASGVQFDREFISMTIDHHKGAIKMTDMALKRSQNSDVRDRAQMIHDKQRDEVARMEKMLKEMN